MATGRAKRGRKYDSGLAVVAARSRGGAGVGEKLELELQKSLNLEYTPLAVELVRLRPGVVFGVELPCSFSAVMFHFCGACTYANRDRRLPSPPSRRPPPARAALEQMKSPTRDAAAETRPTCPALQAMTQHTRQPAELDLEIRSASTSSSSQQQQPAPELSGGKASQIALGERDTAGSGQVVISDR